MLRTLSAKKLRAFYDSNIGKELKVIFEKENKEGRMLGFTENYIRVSASYSEELCNRTLNVRLSDHDEAGFLRCEITDPVPAL